MKLTAALYLRLVRLRLLEPTLLIAGLREIIIVVLIGSLDDALDFLEDWPPEKRDMVYEAASKACHRAYAGIIPIEAGRENFRRFAAKANILEDVVDVPVPLIKGNDRNVGG